VAHTLGSHLHIEFWYARLNHLEAVSRQHHWSETLLLLLLAAGMPGPSKQSTKFLPRHGGLIVERRRDVGRFKLNYGANKSR